MGSSYSPLAAINTAAAAGGNMYLKQALDGIIKQQAILAAASGTGGTVSTSTGTANASANPPSGDFTVAGQDGNFIIDVTFPQNITPLTQAVKGNTPSQNPTGAAMYYQLRSAVDIGMTTTLTTYDPDTAVHKVIGKPNTTLYWQIRFSYDSQNWTDWEYFTSATVCGPVPVWSGLMRSSSSGLVDSPTTPEGGSPLSQSGTSKTINVAASIFTAGDQSPIHYNSGSVTPASYGTWLIYAIDQFRTGGTVTFIATQTSSDITNSLYAVYFGAITTASGGGGTGSGGGGGTCCRAGVPFRKCDGTNADCSTLEVGDLLMGIDGGPEVIEQIDVIPGRPCFHLEFDLNTGKLTKKQYIGDSTVYRVHLDRTHTYLAGANGIIDGACSEHIIQYAGGGFTDVFSAVPTEPYALVNGAVGSHNVLKENTF